MYLDRCIMDGLLIYEYIIYNNYTINIYIQLNLPSPCFLSNATTDL